MLIKLLYTPLNISAFCSAFVKLNCLISTMILYKFPIQITTHTLHHILLKLSTCCLSIICAINTSNSTSAMILIVKT